MLLNSLHGQRSCPTGIWNDGYHARHSDCHRDWEEDRGMNLLQRVEVTLTIFRVTDCPPDRELLIRWTHGRECTRVNRFQILVLNASFLHDRDGPAIRWRPLTFQWMGSSSGHPGRAFD
jgi:hypothetical protein